MEHKIKIGEYTRKYGPARVYDVATADGREDLGRRLGYIDTLTLQRILQDIAVAPTYVGKNYNVNLFVSDVRKELRLRGELSPA